MRQTLAAFCVPRCMLIAMNAHNETIAVITTGGTIDKAYFDALSQFQIGDSVIHRLLTIAQVTRPYRLIELLRKDSLELTDADRIALHDAVAALPERLVVITHGTDTMTQSAAVLTDVKDKTIVLTGALAPARFAESDASFNLGMAFAAVQSLSTGVYITMNGQVFPAGRVRKDRSNARFVAE
jgi:L-asparaginase